MKRLYIILALFALIIVLHHAFPSVLQDSGTVTQLIYLVMLLVLLTGGARTFKKGFLRDLSIWLAIMAVLVFAYSFRDDLGRNRLLSELVPSTVHIGSDGTLSIRSSENGHFFVDGEVNGVAVRFLIDTGASGITLTPHDAQRAGFSLDALQYTGNFSTANGNGRGAPVTLRSLEVGSIRLEQVPADVNGSYMRESLLGMSFLRKLKGFRVEGSTLVLVPN